MGDGEPPADEGASGQTQMKKCPDCAELVQPEARICRYCRYDFDIGLTADRSAILEEDAAPEPEVPVVRDSAAAVRESDAERKSLETYKIRALRQAKARLAKELSIVLFSKSGFGRKLVQAAEERDNLSLVGVDQPWEIRLEGDRQCGISRRFTGCADA